MRSISGFNNGSVQGSTNNPLLNKVGSGVDMASTNMSNDVQYIEGTGGTVYALPQQVYYAEVNAAPDCPFQVYNFAYDEESEKYRVQILPGTINNLCPAISDADETLMWDDQPSLYYNVHNGALTGVSSFEKFIYIKSGSQADPAQFPVQDVADEKYPFVLLTDSQVYSDDNWSVVLIARVGGIRSQVPGSDPPEYKETLIVQQLIKCNSLWAERFKCADNPATYWYSSV